MPTRLDTSPEAQRVTTLVRSVLATDYFLCEAENVALERNLLKDDEGDSIAMQVVFLVDVIIDIEEQLGLEEGEVEIDAEELLGTGGTVGDLVQLFVHGALRRQDRGR